MFQIANFTQPAETPVSLTEAREYLRIDTTSDDNRITGMIGAATRSLEEYLGIRFVAQEVDIFLDRFPVNGKTKWWDGMREVAVSEVVTPERAITLPIGNCLSVVHFKTFSDESEFTEDLSNYNIDLKGDRVRVGLKLSGVWPTTVLRSVNGINFRVNSGWANAAGVPSDVKQAVLQFSAHMYENRGDQNEMKIPAHIMTLIDHRKRVKLGF